MSFTSPHKGIKYNGAKGKCLPIVPIIQSFIPSGGLFHAPFCGSCKIEQYITHCRRVLTDNDPIIISLLKAIQNGWNPPSRVSERDYKYWMKQRGVTTSPMMGFVGYGCSFGGRYFQGYARSRKGYVNFASQCRAGLLRQKPFLRDATFAVADYQEPIYDDDGKSELIPDVIYCDPPYMGTKPVGGRLKRFNHFRFYKWAIAKAEHSIVLVSEYKMPVWVPHKVLWRMEVAAGIRFGTRGDGGERGSGRKKIEKLYQIGYNPTSARGLFNT